MFYNVSGKEVLNFTFFVEVNSEHLLLFDENRQLGPLLSLFSIRIFTV